MLLSASASSVRRLRCQRYRYEPRHAALGDLERSEGDWRRSLLRHDRGAGRHDRRQDRVEIHRHPILTHVAVIAVALYVDVVSPGCQGTVERYGPRHARVSDGQAILR